jgi:16S rRNA C967 or C1407 C5-methylase (RsmB/RsmF family)
VVWKERKRVDARNAAQAEILAHEWRLLLKKEGDMVYRCVIGYDNYGHQNIHGEPF